MQGERDEESWYDMGLKPAACTRGQANLEMLLPLRILMNAFHTRHSPSRTSVHMFNAQAVASEVRSGS
jgi:hypothetical protein